MIPLMKNTFLEEEKTKKALADFIINSNRLSMGETCETFESAFSAYQKRKHSILFNSGGSANLAMLQALKNLGRLKSGDKIGFSALTWSTNVMPIIQMGLVPIAIDCTLETLNVSSKILAQVHEKHHLQGVFLTNVLGFLGDLKNIQDYCNKQGIVLLEDNCESLGSSLPEGKSGNFSSAASFSFFVAHHMSTIEGGMACTDDDDLAEMLKIVRANGWDRNLTTSEQTKWRTKFGIKSEFQAKYTFYDLGYNFRPTEITGFLGLTQLQYLDANVKTRLANYLKLDEVIKQNDDIIHLDHSHMTCLSSFAVPIICKTPELKATYVKIFTDAGVELRPVIAGNMQKQPFYAKYATILGDLNVVDFIHECGFYFGNYPELSNDDLVVLMSCLKKR